MMEGRKPKQSKRSSRAAIRHTFHEKSINFGAQPAELFDDTQPFLSQTDFLCLKMAPLFQSLPQNLRQRFSRCRGLPAKLQRRIFQAIRNLL